MIGIRFAVTAAACIALASCASPGGGSAGAGASAAQGKYAKMQAAQAEATRASFHPGDDVMNCEALETELIATMRDPAVQDVFAKNGADAKDAQAKINNAKSPVRTVAIQGALAIASAFVPGVGMIAGATQMGGPSPQNIAAGVQVNQEIMQMADRMQPIMPQLMRAQRVSQLAQNKECAFMHAKPAPKPSH